MMLHNVNYVNGFYVRKRAIDFLNVYRSFILSIKIRSNNYGVAQ